MNKEVTINGKTYHIVEMPYIEAINLDPNDRTAMAKKLLKFSAGLNEDEISKLTLKEGLELQKYINEVNYGADFQKPVEEDKS